MQLLNGAVDYFKPKRFTRHGMRIPPERAHRHLSESDARYLLKGRVLVEEKMDGTPAAFLAGGTHIIFAEDLRRRHSVFYRIPARYCIFDIFDIRRGVFVFSEEKAELSMAVRDGKLKVEGASGADFFPVASLGAGVFTLAELVLMAEAISAYAKGEKGEPANMEGIVVKPDRDLYPEEQLRGKIVRPEFDADIDEHYLRLPEVRNIIDPSTPLVLRYRLSLPGPS